MIKVPKTFLAASAVFAALFTSECFAECKSDAKAAGIQKLAVFSNGGKLLRSGDAGKYSLSKDLSKRVNYGFYLPSAKGRAGGMLLVKITDFTKAGGPVDDPKTVRLSRSASKRFSILKKFSLEDLEGLELGTTSASVLEYQLVHLLKERINLTNDLLEWHRGYAVGNSNKETYRSDLKQRVLFAFDDVILNLPEEKRKILYLAIKNISNDKAFASVIEKAVGKIDKPTISFKGAIVNLESRLYYYEKIEAGGGMNFCFDHNPKDGVSASKFEIVDVDPDENRAAQKLVNLQIDWN